MDGDLTERAEAADVEHKQCLKVAQRSVVAHAVRCWQPFNMARRLTLAGLLVVVGVALFAAPAHAERLKPADRKEIRSVLDQFVRTAVTRKDPAASWNLVTPQLKAGVSHRAWARGDLPVYPYPAGGRTFPGWRIMWVEPNSVGIDLTLLPVKRERRRIGAIVFGVEIRQVKGRWLVHAFDPQATFAPEGKPPRMFAVADLLPSNGQPTGEPRLGESWWAVALGVLALGPLAAILAWLLVVARPSRASSSGAGRRAALPPLAPRVEERLRTGK